MVICYLNDMHKKETTNADQVVAILKNVRLRINWNIQRASGQCPDGASTKAGKKTEVATQIKTIKEKCLWTHCYGHASNLAVADAIKSVQCISGSLDTVRGIEKLVKNTMLEKVCAPVSEVVEHRVVTREVVSLTTAGPSLRVLK